MASQQPAGSCPTAQVVGNAFVHQYYHIMHQSPELVYRFYQDISKLGRPETDGSMSAVTTMQTINEKILSLDYSKYRAEIKTVDAQDSFNGGVLVLVTGYLTGKDNVRSNFTQSFFLAPQDKGYFVLNDMFRYMEELELHDGNQGLPNDEVAPLAPEQDLAPAQEHQSTEQPVPEEEVNVEEVYNHSDNEGDSVVEEEAPVSEVVDEIQIEPQMVTESSSAVQEEVPKKSYASIVKVMKENAAPLSAPAPSPVRPGPANQERQMAPTQSPSPANETPVSNSNAAENGSHQEGEGDGHSIYIRNLPLNATPAQLEEEFKRFGPIKVNGVQVRSNKQQAFCFGFVEFEVASAVQSAIEASPIMIGGRQAFVEEKRASSSRVNNRGRFPVGRGTGFRNDGARGRGNYGGGRGYGRNDFNRNEFANRSNGGGRGGSSNRGDGGYGGRVNRAGLAVNETEKTVAPRVPATA
ncbi:PREDICTED: ras GTPase-activating protein-binding protein 1-like isoform X2 [Nelumbo nucifera]|uniref:Ras GTPase-activating protein-binding protein 1-like isoform X2 n=1 Tax=Nelumbo nucifera TaxID=4432 RepID=A0A1U7Z3J2_NELNU|nr:PREDICTED: ras GTPase-activating protein-binding protein 1-like isoform X2 [Nelumbo nucifera]